MIKGNVDMNDTICEKLKNVKICELFKQIDWMIINFGDPIKFSLHIACTVRICQNEKIILNMSDEFFTKDGLPKTEETYAQLDKDGYINDPNSLLAENISKVNALLKGKCVKSVSMSKWKDMVLTFDDGIEIQVTPDCLERNFEYYRFIEFVPHYDDDPKRYKSIHYSVINDNGQPRELRS